MALWTAGRVPFYGMPEHALIDKDLVIRELNAIGAIEQ